jgi:hypothetical protein
MPNKNQIQNMLSDMNVRELREVSKYFGVPVTKQTGGYWNKNSLVDGLVEGMHNNTPVGRQHGGHDFVVGDRVIINLPHARQLPKKHGREGKVVGHKVYSSGREAIIVQLDSPKFPKPLIFYNWELLRVPPTQ